MFGLQPANTTYTQYLDRCRQIPRSTCCCTLPPLLTHIAQHRQRHCTDIDGTSPIRFCCLAWCIAHTATPKSCHFFRGTLRSFPVTLRAPRANTVSAQKGSTVLQQPSLKRNLAYTHHNSAHLNAARWLCVFSNTPAWCPGLFSAASCPSLSSSAWS